jgi:hypothetical protein
LFGDLFYQCLADPVVGGLNPDVENDLRGANSCAENVMLNQA